MTKNNKKGFSLVELLVAMAIIAILIAIAAFGIQILQRNARNTQRRKIVQDLVLSYNDVIANGGNPDGLNPNGQNLEWVDGGNNPVGTARPAEGVFTDIDVTGACLATDEVRNGLNLHYDDATGTIGVAIEGATGNCFEMTVE